MPSYGAAVASTADFGLDLYAKLVAAEPDANVFLSPYSIASALAMTAEGARGETALEMGRVLRYPEAARQPADGASPWRMALIHEGFASINRELNGSGGDGDAEALKATRDKLAALRKQLDAANAEAKKLEDQQKWKESGAAAERSNKLAATIDQYELRIANALWGEKTYPFQQSYLDTIARHYDTGGVFNVDFRNNFPAARERINAWVVEQTEDRIKDIIPQLPPEEAKLVRLILTNAIYFKGEWAEPFEEKNTQPRDFNLAGGGKIKTPIMQGTIDRGSYAAFNADGSLFATPRRVPAFDEDKGPARYPAADGFAMIELPYKGGDLSMIVIAPNTPAGLPAIEKQLTREAIHNWINKLDRRDVNVLLPKFKLETEYQLGETLKAMGMQRAFTDPGQNPARGADFSGMSASNDPDDRLYIGKVIHKAFVEVNEKGTEAAAATAVIMVGATSAPVDMPFTPTFNADRPFLYLIRDTSTNTILFLGRMMNPTK